MQTNKQLVYELMGVIADTKHNKFDRVCLDTLSRVAQQLLQQGEVVVTKNPEGQIVCVSRQDDEGRILSVIDEPTSVPNEWADLWYFVMDEEPVQFEAIVSAYPPVMWHQKAHELMRKKYPK